jgi:hypothetical protein
MRSGKNVKVVHISPKSQPLHGEFRSKKIPANAKNKQPMRCGPGAEMYNDDTGEERVAEKIRWE